MVHELDRHAGRQGLDVGRGETDGEGFERKKRLIDQFIAATYAPPIRIAGIVECAQIGPLKTALNSDLQARDCRAPAGALMRVLRRKEWRPAP